jgi:hypothetical protein
MKAQQKDFLVPFSIEEFVDRVETRIRDHNPSRWDKMNPDYLELGELSIKNNLLVVQKTFNPYSRRIQFTGYVKAQLQNHNYETKLTAHYFPDSGLSAFITWLIAIFMAIIWVIVMIFKPSILAVVIFILIQIAMICLRFIATQESEFDLQNYFSRMLKELTRT